MKYTKSPEAKLLKLRRQYRELSAIKVSDFSAKLAKADYDVWVEDVKQKIAAINQRNK